MNQRCYRLVSIKLRGVPVAVAKTAVSRGKAASEETGRVAGALTLFAMRHAAFAAVMLFGLTPMLSDAQIVPFGCPVGHPAWQSVV